MHTDAQVTSRAQSVGGHPQARSSETPVFIVGAPRSGTTLLQYMLRSHPELSLPTGESHFLVPLYRDQTRFKALETETGIRAFLQDLHRRNPQFLETDLHGIEFDIDRLAPELWAEGRRTVRDLIAGLFEKNAAGEGKHRWGDKTPYYVLHMPKLLDWFPKAQFIHLVRDGRDVAASMLARGTDFGVYNPYFAAKVWEQYVEIGNELGQNMAGNQYLEIRYEDLLTDPEGTVRQVCGYLQMEYDPRVIHFEKSGEAGKTPLLQQPVQASNTEKWRQQWTPSQLRTLEGSVGKTLKQFGYPIVTSTVRLPPLKRAYYRLHNHACVHLQRWSTG